MHSVQPKTGFQTNDWLNFNRNLCLVYCRTHPFQAHLLLPGAHTLAQFSATQILLVRYRNLVLQTVALLISILRAKKYHFWPLFVAALEVLQAP